MFGVSVIMGCHSLLLKGQWRSWEQTRRNWCQLFLNQTFQTLNAVAGDSDLGRSEAGDAGCWPKVRGSRSWHCSSHFVSSAWLATLPW